MTHKQKNKILKDRYNKIPTPDCKMNFWFSSDIRDWYSRKPPKRGEVSMDDYVPKQKKSATVKMKGKCNNIGKFL